MTGYASPTWVDVPPGTVPPESAPQLDAANLQLLTDAVAAAPTTFVALPVAAPAAVPGAPTNAVAVANNGQAQVSWVAPTAGAPIASHTVTASPGGATATASWPALTATVAGLTNGTAYTFTVKANNAAGASAASAASASVTPSPDPGGLGIQGCIAWFAADALAGPPSNGAAVSSWPDASGNGFTGTQATSANRPTFLSSWTNSKPALTFDGSAFTMPTTLTQAAIGGYMTVFVVVDITANSGDRRILCNQLTGTDGNANDLDANGPAWRCIIAGGSLNNPTATTNTPTIVSITSPGFEYANGTKFTTGNNPGSVASAGGVYWIGSLAGNQKLLPGRVAEVIFYNRVLTDTERHSVESYLSTKYAITVVAQ